MIRRLAKSLLKRLRPESPPPATPVAAPPPEEPDADAERFANMERGAQELKERMEAGEPLTLVDVREPYETQGGIIPGALLIPLGRLPSRWEEIKNADEVVFYCAAGVRSLQAAAFLREQGVINATSMEGGISDWMRLGGRIVML